MHKRHPVLAVGALIALHADVRSGVRGRPVGCSSPPGVAVSLAQRRPDDPIQSRSGWSRSPDQRAGSRAVDRRRSRPGQTSRRPPRRTSTPDSCRLMSMRRTSCRISHPPPRWTERDRLRRRRRDLRPAVRARLRRARVRGPGVDRPGDRRDRRRRGLHERRLAARSRRVPGRGVPLGPGARVWALPEPRPHRRQRSDHRRSAMPAGPRPSTRFRRRRRFAGRIETMYPFLFINGGQATPHADDIAMFSTLYPEPTFATTTGAITGQHRRAEQHDASDRRQRHRPQHRQSVRRRGVGDLERLHRQLRTGSPFVGVYTLRGLTPGASYAVYVDEILAGGFSTPPRVPLPGPEEFYNGADRIERRGHRPAGERLHAGRRAGGRHDVRTSTSSSTALPPGPIPAGRRYVHRALPELPLQVLRAALRLGVRQLERQPDLRRRRAPTSVETIAGMLTGPPRIAGAVGRSQRQRPAGSVTLLRDVAAR